MKKTTGSIVTLVFAALTFLFAILVPINTEEPTLISWIMTVIIALGAVAMWAAPQFLKNKQLTIIPVAAIALLATYLQSMMAGVLSQLLEGMGGTVPTVNEYETLGLMLTVAFVVAMVFVFKNGAKWAVTVTVVYSALMLVSQVEMLFTCAMAYSSASALTSAADTNLLPLIFLPLALVCAYATQTAMFASLRAEEKPAEAPAEVL